MFVVVNRIPVKNEFQEKFETSFGKSLEHMKDVGGLLKFNLLRPETEETPYLVMTTWESEENYNNWVNSDSFKKSHTNAAEMREAASGRPKLEKFSVAL